MLQEKRTSKRQWPCRGASLLALFWVCFPLNAGHIALINGKSIKCKGAYEIKNRSLEYRNEEGTLFRIPLKLVNMSASSMDDSPAQVSIAPEVKPKKKKKDSQFYDLVSRSGVGSDRDKSASITDNSLQEHVGSNLKREASLSDYELRVGMYTLDRAVRNNDLASLKLALIPGLPLNDPISSDGNTLIHVAAENGNPMFVSLLLKAGARPDSPNAYGDTALLVALKKNSPPHKKVAFLLLDAGANPNRADISKVRPLHLALQNRDATMLAALIKFNVDIHARNPFGDPGVIMAIQGNDLACLAVLLESGGNPNCTNKSGSSALLEAVKGGNAKLIGLLVKKGANLNQISAGLSPLFLAVTNDDLNTTSLLLGLGANANLKLQGQDGPAQVAVRNGSQEILVVLAKSGLKLNYPPLVPVAVTADRPAMVKTLLFLGADANGRDSDGEPSLVLASRAGSLDMVHSLLDAGADVYQKSSRGYSAYLEASGPKQEEIKAALRAKFSK